MKMTDGYRCKACGKQHKYPAYVYAHWNEELIHTCDCGARVEIIHGNAQPLPPAKGKQ